MPHASLDPSGPDGLHTVALRPCTASVLRFIGHGQPWFVWLPAHRPETAVRWWRAHLPIHSAAPPVTLAVRDLRYDLQVPRGDLDDLLPHLKHQGVEALFMDRPVPDTLTLRGLEPSAESRVLRANGCRARFFLPHENEVAVLASVSRQDLDTWLAAGLVDWVQRPAGA